MSTRNAYEAALSVLIQKYESLLAELQEKERRLKLMESRHETADKSSDSWEKSCYSWMKKYDLQEFENKILLSEVSRLQQELSEKDRRMISMRRCENCLYESVGWDMYPCFECSSKTNDKWEAIDENKK